MAFQNKGASENVPKNIRCKWYVKLLVEVRENGGNWLVGNVARIFKTYNRVLKETYAVADYSRHDWKWSNSYCMPVLIFQQLPSVLGRWWILELSCTWFFMEKKAILEKFT